MTIKLTSDIRHGGAIVPANTTVTYDPAVEADLVARKSATYVGAPATTDLGVPAMVKQNLLTGRIEVNAPASKTLTLHAATADTLFAQLPTGEYVGTSNDSAGYFGSQLWVGSGAITGLSKTAMVGTRIASLKTATGAAMPGGAVLDNAWLLPNGNVIMATTGGSRHHLHLVKMAGAGSTVGANSPDLNDGKAVLDVGYKDGVHPQHVRALHARSLAVVDIAGTDVLLFGEYNVNAVRTYGGLNDQVRVWRSNDMGVTWSIMLDWNGAGDGVQHVRHLHGIVQDPATKCVYFLIGDNPQSAILRWDTVGAAPPANTPVVSYRSYAGWSVLYNSATPDDHRTGDLVFNGDVCAYLTDNAADRRFWRATTLTRWGRLRAQRNDEADLSAGRDPLIGCALPGRGAVWFSMWATPAGTKNFDVWATSNMADWDKIGEMTEYGTTGSEGVLKNVFLNLDGQIVVTQSSGYLKIVPGSNFGGSVLFDISTFFSGRPATLS